MRFRGLVVGILVGLTFFTGLGTAHAACPGPTPAIAALDPAARLDFLNRKMRAELKPAQTWTLAFGAIYAVATIGQVAIAPLVKQNDAIDYYVGAASTAIGSISMMVTPLGALNDAPLARDAPAGASEAEVCKMLADAEARFSTDAEGEAFGRGVLTHIGNAIVNIAGLLVLGLGYHRWESGFFNFGVGMVLGEAFILTQPHALPNAWNSYRAANLN